MEYAVLNRWSGEIQFTAKIECNEDASVSTKLGLAVKWAIANNADLRSADLRSANLTYADLSGADLRSADLNSANLRSADLINADLRSANLTYADLRNADLSSSDLSDANLRSANLRSANLRSADLRSADLSDANLSNADLSNAKNAPVVIHWLPWTTFVHKDYVKIGCQEIYRHEIETWGNDITRERWREFFPFKKVIIAIWEYAFPDEEYDNKAVSVAIDAKD
jgi:hypothetical protein